MNKNSNQLMTDAEIKRIADSESHEAFWNRMFFAGIAAEVSNADDAAWRAKNGRSSDEK